MDKSSEAPLSQSWSNAHKHFSNSGQELVYPSETLIRLFRGNYITGEVPELNGKKILDVGFGGANNTALFASLGMEAHGVEIHQDICDLAERKMKSIGHKVDFKVGSNQSLPYSDGYFDYIVSWNVLHYEGSEDGIKKALLEHKRVLKKGGRLILSTTGPGHKILLNSQKLSPHHYKIGRPGDFRQGQVHFFFEDEENIRKYFSPHFSDLKIGRIEDLLFTEKLDWFLVTGTR
jgi:SAM-dependent methyltransferase